VGRPGGFLVSGPEANFISKYQIMCRANVLKAFGATGCILFITPALVAWQGQPKPAAARAFVTPETVFQAYHEATSKGDWQAAASYLTAESQAMMADALVMAATSSATVDPKKEAGVTQLLRRHGANSNA
jgi:hypothetical protein